MKSNAEVAKDGLSAFALENRFGPHEVLHSLEDQMAKIWRSALVEEKIAALENAFRQVVPIGEGGGIQHELIIAGLGRYLWQIAPHESRDDEGRAIWPVAPVARGKARILVLKAANALEGLTPETAYEMGLNWGELHLLRLSLMAAASRSKPSLGSPRKDQARKIAETVASHYSALTGKKPTVPKKDGKAYGPFMELLTTVFKILDVRASPLSAAECATRRWKGAKKLLGCDYGI